MTVLHLREYATSAPLALDAGTIHHLQSSEAVTVAFTAAGECLLTANSRVGQVIAPGLELHIQPKVGVGRLLHLLLTVQQDAWLAVEVAHDHADDLLEALTRLFLDRAELALRQGVLQGYVQVEESLPTMRGRLREGQQASKRFGLAPPLEVRYDDYLPDIVENRVVRRAAKVLLGLNPARVLRGRLRHLLGRLQGVSDVTYSRAPKVVITRLNARYGPAVTVACLVIEKLSVAVGGATSRGTGFLFDMNKVFEEFLHVVLGQELDFGRRKLSHEAVRPLDVERQATIRPDLSLWEAGRCLAVLDAKYKDIGLKGHSVDDLYQLLAYCNVLQLDHGYLVFPVPYRTDLRVRGTEMALRLRGVDLAGSIGELESSVRDLASEVVLGTIAPVRA